jgi:hypothetical protein
VATIVKTQRAAYQVSGIKREASGRITLVATQPSGKKRYLTRRDIGSARWYAALAHLYAKTA